MDTNDIPATGPSDWRREPSERLNALMLKLAEEAGEMAVRCVRGAMQGLYEVDPDSGRQNISHIEDEMADVRAQLALWELYVETDTAGIATRAAKKEAFKRPWIQALPDIRPTPSSPASGR